MTNDITEFAKRVITEVIKNFSLSSSISRTEDNQLIINIQTDIGSATVNYNLQFAAERIIKRLEEEFNNYWTDSKSEDQDEYLSLYNSFVYWEAVSIIEIIIKQIASEFEDTIQILPQLAVILTQCIGQEYEKQMFSNEVFQKQEDSKKIIDRFIRSSVKKRKERMMKLISTINSEQKYDLSPIAVHYDKLLPIWDAAKRLYKQLSKLETWSETIKTAYQTYNLPEDLIEKFSSQDKYESMPSNLALEHAARLCGVPPETYQHRRLHQLLAQSRKMHGMRTAKGPKPKVH